MARPVTVAKRIAGWKPAVDVTRPSRPRCRRRMVPLPESAMYRTPALSSAKAVGDFSGAVSAVVVSGALPAAEEPTRWVICPSVESR